MSFESTTQNGQNGQKGAEGKDGRAPRSLTLTFAETNPWEMLVRDRLAALPRGYLKRFLLLLLEGSGMDLANEAVFQEQVEKLLLTKNLASALASGAGSRKTFSAADTPQMQTSSVVREFVQEDPAPSQVEQESAPERRETAPEETPQRSLQSSVTLPASKRQPQAFKDGGFGALEL